MRDVVDFGEDHPPGHDEADECGAVVHLAPRHGSPTHACIDQPGHPGPHTCDCDWTWPA